jgi:hypothetical protein
MLADYIGDAVSTSAFCQHGPNANVIGIARDAAWIEETPSFKKLGDLKTRRFSEDLLGEILIFELNPRFVMD